MSRVGDTLSLKEDNKAFVVCEEREKICRDLENIK